MKQLFFIFVALPCFAEPLLPSFNYGGKQFSSAEWSLAESSGDTRAWRSPDGKLLLKVQNVTYPEYQTEEMRPSLETVGAEETELVDGFDALDLHETPGTRGVRIRALTGSATMHTDFTRRDTILMGREGCKQVVFDTAEGRCGAWWLPYIGVDFSEREGLEIALGWTGNWKAEFEYDGKNFSAKAGLSKAQFKMKPGEKFELPRVLVFRRGNQTRRDADVIRHRFFVEKKSPRDAKGNLHLPRMCLTAGGGNKSDEAMLKVIALAKRMPNAHFDTFWVDAGWYGADRDQPQKPNCPPDWWKTVGSWRVNRTIHPDGNMRRVSTAANAAGMQFLVWFEPERAAQGSTWLTEHPQWFANNPKIDPNHWLIDLGNPEAWNAVVDMVSGHIRESNIGIYRQDFNMSPGPVWAALDKPGRVGVAEIKHINGLWRFWDELCGRFGGMLLENCASGGRRLDYEMTSRAHAYCRDDAHMWPHPEELCQNITLNSTVFLPFSGGETFKIAKGDDYGMLSCIAAGSVFTPTDLGFIYGEFTDADVAWYDKMFGVANRMRPYWTKDFYALTEPAFDGSDVWCAWQLDDPENGKGFFIAFRREKCDTGAFHAGLAGIDADAKYELEIAGGEKRKVEGRELADWVVQLPEPRSFQLAFYRKL